jgi:3-oxoacyl-ACP reductase-like protein
MMGGMMGGMNPGMMGGGMGMGMGMGMGTMNAENFATMSSMQANAGMTNGMPSAGGNGVGEDPQAMMTKYNMLQQKNVLAQEKAMLMQRLAGISNQQNSIDNLSQGTKNPGAVV